MNPYRCSTCGRWFARSDGSVSCCVMHPPGACCHYGEHEVENPMGRGGSSPMGRLLL